MAFNNSIRESNVKVFEDTCLRIKTSKALQDSIKLSNKSQDIILEKDTIEVDKVRFILLNLAHLMQQGNILMEKLQFIILHQQLIPVVV